MLKFLITLILLNANFVNAQIYSSPYYLSKSNLQEYFSEIREEDKGQKGYLKVAKDLFLGNMSDTYEYIQNALGDRKVRELGWGLQYFGNVTEFEMEKVRDMKMYRGVEGYISYAKEYYRGDMERAYKNIYAIHSDHEALLKQLNWGKPFFGSAAQYDAIMEVLHNGTKDIDYRMWFGKKVGLRLAVYEFAEVFFQERVLSEASIKNIERLFLSALSKNQIRSLGWDQSLQSSVNTMIRSLNETRAVRFLKGGLIVEPRKSVRLGMKR